MLHFFVQWSRVSMLFIFIALIFVSIAAAQDNQSSAEWEPLSLGPATTWTAPVIEKGKFAVQSFFYYNRTRGSFDDAGDYQALPEGDKKYQYQQSLFFEYGLAERLEFDSQLIYQETRVRQSDMNARGQGLADSYAFLKYALVQDNGWWPQVSGLFQLKVPTGKFQKADPDKLGTDINGDGAYEHGYGLILTKTIKPLAFHVDAIYSFPLETKVDEVETRYGRNLTYDAAVECFLPKGFNLVFEANGFRQGDTKEDGTYLPSSDNNYVVVSPGIGWSNDTIQALVAYQRVVAGVNNDANDSVVLTFFYEF